MKLESCTKNLPRDCVILGHEPNRCAGKAGSAGSVGAGQARQAAGQGKQGTQGRAHKAAIPDAHRTMLQSYHAIRLPICKVAKPPNYKSIKLPKLRPGCQTTMQPKYHSAKLRSYAAIKPPNYRANRRPCHQATSALGAVQPDATTTQMIPGTMICHN